jgi:hypothetical protein
LREGGHIRCQHHGKGHVVAWVMMEIDVVFTLEYIWYKVDEYDNNFGDDKK